MSQGVEEGDDLAMQEDAGQCDHAFWWNCHSVPLSLALSLSHTLSLSLTHTHTLSLSHTHTNRTVSGAAIDDLLVEHFATQFTETETLN